MVKNLPAVQETWVRALGWGDPLEEGMAAHSSVLAWRIPWAGEPGGLPSMGPHRVSHDCAHATYRPCARDCSQSVRATDRLLPRWNLQFGEQVGMKEIIIQRDIKSPVC